MENKVLFLDPLDIRPHFKCGAEIGTAMLIGSGISALGGAASGILGSSSASSNNARMIEYNRWAQKDAQAYNTQMYERQLADQEAMYNKYQSPQAIAEQLKAAGINPSALAAGHGFSGGSMSSVPSAGSSPITSSPQLQNTGAPIGDAIQQTATAISSLTSSYSSYASGKDTIDTLDHRIKLLISQQEGQELLNAYQTTQNFIMDEFGHDKAGAELQEIHSRIFANYCTGHLAEADKECKEMMTKLYQQQWDMTDEQRGALLGKAYAEWQLVNSKIQTENTQQGLNRASAKNQRAQARLANEQATTVSVLRPEQLNSLRLDNDSKGVDLNIKRETMVDTINKLRSELAANSAISDVKRQEATKELITLEEEFDDYYNHPGLERWHRIVKYINNNMPVISAFKDLLSPVK